jgi:DNA polymerase
MILVHLDFETYSDVDLKKVGAYRYAEDPSTEVLCLAYSIGEGPVKLWHPLLSTPADLLEALCRQDYMLAGWNSGSFERRIWNIVCTLDFGWPELPKEKFYDVMSDALACGFPASAEEAAIATGAKEKKDQVGKALIKKLCQPCKPTKKNGGITRWTKELAPDDFRALYDYCIQDVKTERAIMHALPAQPTLSGMERKIWRHTQDINDRGMPIDIETVQILVRLIDAKKKQLEEEVTLATNYIVDRPTQRDRIKNFLKDNYDLDLPDMQGTTLDNVLETLEEGPAKRLVEIYREYNHASIAKFKRLLTQICSDGTIKDNLVYHKAGTGRYAGAGFQMQNLPRATSKIIETVLEAIHKFELDVIEFIHGNIIELAKCVLRPIICAPPGKTLTCDDLTGIEARMTSWVAGEKELLKKMGQGLDVYRLSASEMYGILYELIPKSSKERQSGKVCVLAGGFGGGENAIYEEAQKQGLDITREDAGKMSRDFRRGRPKLPKTWRAFGDAALEAVKNPGQPVLVRTNVKFSFCMFGPHLAMSIPSGRKLWFPFARAGEEMAPWGKMVEHVSAMWVNSVTKRWERRVITGASFFQSAVQGLARDVLMEAQLRIDPVYPVIGSVHDECFSLTPATPEYSIQGFQKLFAQVPTWCPDMPIDSDPWQGRRYRK